jgi:chemotaxis response regulator CheB
VAQSDTEAFEMAKAVVPDVVLIDIRIGAGVL